METYYGITGREKLDMGLLIVGSQNKINDVKRYLKSLRWDGVKRVDTLLSVYLALRIPLIPCSDPQGIMRCRGPRSRRGREVRLYADLYRSPGNREEHLLVDAGKGMVLGFADDIRRERGGRTDQGTWINEVGE